MSEDLLKKFAGQSLSLDELGIKTGEGQVTEAPAGGEAFAAGSIIAEWQGRIMYWFLSEANYVEWNQDADDDEKVPRPDVWAGPLSGYYAHYYLDRATAQRANNILPHEVDSNKQPYKVQSHLVYSADPHTVLNRTADGLAATIAGFGDSIDFDAGKIITLMKGKKKFKQWSRHIWNFVSFPCLVAAAAQVMGIDNAGYSIEELIVEGAEDTFNEEFFTKYFGDVEGGYEECVFAKRRDRLWASLGEENSRAHALFGSTFTTSSGREKAHPLATTSENLSKCLSLAYGTWSRKLWARVVNVPNPGNEVLEKSGPTTIHALTEFFIHKEHALAVAQAELAERGEEAGVAGAPVGDFPMPTRWAEQGGRPEDVIEHFKSSNVEGIVDNPPDPIKKTVVEKLYCRTYDEVLAVRDYILEKGL